MSPLIAGVLVFAGVSSVTGLLMIVSLRRAQTEGRPVAVALLPYLAADAIFVAIFVVWLLQTL